MEKFNETRLPVCNCPECDAPLDCSTGLFGALKPSHGDVSVCLYCGTILKFKKNMTLRRLTNAETIEALKDERLAKIEIARQHTMRFERHGFRHRQAKH